MRIYSRVMQGSASKPAIPTLVVYCCVPLLLIAAVVIDMAYIRAIAASPIGIAAGLAIVAGFLVKRFMSWLPWAFVAGALLFDAGGKLSTTEWLTSILTVSSYLSLIAGVTVGTLQLKVLVADKTGRPAPSPARWGSTIVAGGLLIGSASFHLIGPPDAGVTSRGLEGDMELRLSTDYTTPERVGRIQHPAITESSGLAASRLNPGLLWTHNDSGNEPVIYCLTETADHCGAWEVSGSSVEDWEDLATGPGPESGRTYLYIGDIGDNDRVRESITIYRVPEPSVGVSMAGRKIRNTEPSSRLVLRYPDRPHDAEALIVHPKTKDVYILTKDFVPRVYKARMRFGSATPVALHKVAQLSVSGGLSQITGADISSDGRRVVLSTYSAAFELVFPPDADVTIFDRIWRQPSLRIDVGQSGQREAIAYSVDGRGLFVTSEGSRAPVHSVRRG